MKVKISEIKKLLAEGKKVKVKTINNEFVPVIRYVEKGSQPTYLVSLSNGNSIKVTSKHRFFTNSGWLEAGDVRPGQTKLFCDDGEYYDVSDVEYVGFMNIVDITVDHKDHSYFGNGILNHNTGKSYMAMQIAANALKIGVDVVYFDSEAAVDPDFVEKILNKNGFTVNDLIYVQAVSIEFVMETIEEMLSESERPLLFILDSLANCPTRRSLEMDFDPLASIAEKARILALAFQKLTTPLANHNSTLLILNQLKTNITNNMSEKLTDPYVVPGGKAPLFAYSLRIWLTMRKGKDSFIYNDRNEKIGSEIKCFIKKSRFGTMNRECETKILWGGNKISFQEEELWLDVIKGSESYSQNGAWSTVSYDDGTEEKFVGKSFIEKLNSNPKFHAKVLEMIDEVLLSSKNPATVSYVDHPTDTTPL